MSDFQYEMTPERFASAIKELRELKRSKRSDDMTPRQMVNHIFGGTWQETVFDLWQNSI